MDNFCFCSQRLRISFTLIALSLENKSLFPRSSEPEIEVDEIDNNLEGVESDSDNHESEVEGSDENED